LGGGGAGEVKRFKSLIKEKKERKTAKRTQKERSDDGETRRKGGTTLGKSQ